MESKIEVNYALMGIEAKPTNQCFDSKDEYFFCLENDGQLFTRNNKNCQNQFTNWMKDCNRVHRKEFLMDRFINNQYRFYKGRFIKQ